MRKALQINSIWLGLIVVSFACLQLGISTGLIGDVIIQLLVQIGISLMMAMSLNLVVGFTGQFSFGSSGFMAIGAYATAIIGSYFPSYPGFACSVLVGMVVSLVLALVIGKATTRLRGDYLAVATLGASEIIRILIMNGGELTNGAAGLSDIPLFTNWQLVFVASVLSAIVLLNIVRSDYGRAGIAIREDEIAAESMGVAISRVKLWLFGLSAMITALAGSLYAGFIGTVTPKDFQAMSTTNFSSINILIFVVLGGIGSMTGTVLAVLILSLANLWLQDLAALRMIIYALVLIGVMIFRPGGLMGQKEWTLSAILHKKQEG